MNSQNGARIKSNSDTVGYIAGLVNLFTKLLLNKMLTQTCRITYQNISIANISTYGIDIQCDYLNGGPTGMPTNGVIITDIVMDNITGTVQSGAKDYYILCGESNCSNFTFNSISVVGGKNDSCNFKPAGDFVC